MLIVVFTGGGWITSGSCFLICNSLLSKISAHTQLKLALASSYIMIPLYLIFCSLLVWRVWEFITLSCDPAGLDVQVPPVCPWWDQVLCWPPVAFSVYGTRQETFHTVICWSVQNIQVPSSIFRKVLCDCPPFRQRLLSNTSYSHLSAFQCNLNIPWCK